MYDLPNDRERNALLRIAAAITGTNSESNANGNRIAGALERLADWFENNTLATGASLPTVTADDNGSTLTVVEGAWAAVAPVESQNDAEPTT